jgi:hypothetical protein
VEALARIQTQLAQSGLSPDQLSATAMHYLGRVIHAQAYTLGFRDSFLMVALIFAFALIPAWIMGRHHPRDT